VVLVERGNGWPESFHGHVCKKQTREVNGSNGSLGLCALCQAKCECGNQLSDSGFAGEDAWAVFEKCESPAECEKLLAVELAKLGEE
jgi:hypothetical protein